MVSVANIYIKQVTHNSVVCFLMGNEEDSQTRIAARLKVDANIYNTLLEKLLESQYQKVTINNGMIIAIGDASDIEYNDDSIMEFIVDTVNTHQTMKKKKLYAIVQDRYLVSDKTMQRRMKEITRLYPNIHMDYTTVWVNANGFR